MAEIEPSASQSPEVTEHARHERLAFLRYLMPQHYPDPEQSETGIHADGTAALSEEKTE